MSSRIKIGCVFGGVVLFAACSSASNDASTTDSTLPDGGDGIDGGGVISTGGDDGGIRDASSDAGGGLVMLPDGAIVMSDGAVAICEQPALVWMHDGMKDCGETDVDCGGTATTTCDSGRSCAAAGDCTSVVCDYGNHCALAKSCISHFGGDTCGSGEIGDPTAAHESCCVSLPVPIATHTPQRALDKYQVTAGRMRAFLTDVGNNVLAWVQANRATLPADVQTTLPATSDQYLPAGTDGMYGIYNQLAGFIYYKNEPSDLQGCFIAGTGTHTYWFPDAVELAQGDDFKDSTGNVVAAHAFSQEILDVKALNCIAEPLAAAFCAWDGGRLQYKDEADSAYGPDLYPWGASPNAGGYQGSATVVGPAALGMTGVDFTITPCPTCNVTLINWSHDYVYPAQDPVRTFDYAFYLSAPGRFPQDKGPNGHMDVAANIMAWTATLDGTEDGVPAYDWSKNGSWEGHNVGNDQYRFNLMTKYGKAGLRCAR